MTCAAALCLLLGSAGSVAAQDAAAGEKIFAQCRACHQVGPTARNGVGPKLAQRIVMELKDKVGGIALGLGPAVVNAAPGASADAVSAMLNLGFRPAEASVAVAAADEELGPGATLDALVRLALRKASKP